jgi:hypothetical protein
VDEVVEKHGFGPRTMYVEMCWLPVLGPTATWLFRRLGSWAEYNPDGVTVDMVDLAVNLGLGEGLTKNGKLSKGIDRLVRFGAADWVGDELQVRRALALLPQRYLGNLGYSARRYHEELVRQRAAEIAVDRTVITADNGEAYKRTKGGESWWSGQIKKSGSSCEKSGRRAGYRCRG